MARLDAVSKKTAQKIDKLAAHIRKRQHADYQAQRRSIFELYIEEVARSLHKITGRSEDAIKRDFLRLADKVTEADLDDAALEEQSRKVTRRPRTAEREEAE